MKPKHEKTLAAIFENPVNGSLDWARIEALFIALGCRVIEGQGSSVTFEMNGVRAYFHRLILLQSCGYPVKLLS
ncbi:hypothetical protein DSM19430T_27260 [Desulfovibrio psychrotolerans]|uniref:HicA protein n=1 Tax=Desulfovibrio psychrotolerans TaxID=415242 RepID=A0A7J0BXX6_9BACT|nr:hypothetical protein DSM19430T_27260 [Desulfovibrio psychrotolerans]